MQRINDSIKLNKLLKTLGNLPDSTEKRTIEGIVKDSYEQGDVDFEEWVNLDDAYYVCDKCKRQVQEFWHKHTAYTRLIDEPVFMTPPQYTEICLCKACYNEMMTNIYERQ